MQLQRGVMGGYRRWAPLIGVLVLLAGFATGCRKVQRSLRSWIGAEPTEERRVAAPQRVDKAGASRSTQTGGSANRVSGGVDPAGQGSAEATGVSGGDSTADEADISEEATVANGPLGRKPPSWASANQARAPQPVGARGVFEAVRLLPVSGDRLSTFYLICRVKAGRGFDAFRGPDISMRMKLPGRLPVKARAADNAYTGFVAARVAKLNKGQTVAVSAWDRDATTSELIGHARMRYDGRFPLKEEFPRFACECRGVALAHVTTLLQDQLAAFDKDIRQAPARLVVQTNQEDSGFLYTPIRGLRRDVVGLASLAGWHDPRVQQRVARVNVLFERWVERATAAVAAAVKTLPGPGAVAQLSGERLSVKVTDVKGCAAVGPGKPSCRVTLEVHNTGDKNLRCSSFNGWLGKARRWHIVGADGRWGAMGIVSCPSSVASGQKVTVVLVPKRRTFHKTVTDLADPQILVIADFSRRRADLIKFR